VILSPARGFVLSRRERGEADLVLELLLDDGSFRRAVAPSGARSSKRFAGGLSPFTLYRFTFGRAKGAGFVRVDEAVVADAWPGILGDLRRTAAAGVVCALARELVGEGTSDESVFTRVNRAFDALATADARAAGGVMVAFAMGMLEAAGEPVMLDACARCGRAAPENASVTISPRSGGVVCAACGGGPTLVKAAARRAWRAVGAGDAAQFESQQLTWMLELIDAKQWRAADVMRGATGYF
jgi:DNA repair protein RecO (recombination protein O)